MKVRLLRQVSSDLCPAHGPGIVRPTCHVCKDAIVAPPGIYKATMHGVDTYVIVGERELRVKPIDFISLNGDGTQSFIRVRPRGDSGWLYLAAGELESLWDYANEAEPGAKWDLEMVTLTPEQVDAMGEFDGW